MIKKVKKDQKNFVKIVDSDAENEMKKKETSRIRRVYSRKHRCYGYARAVQWGMGGNICDP